GEGEGPRDRRGDAGGGRPPRPGGGRAARQGRMGDRRPPLPDHPGREVHPHRRPGHGAAELHRRRPPRRRTAPRPPRRPAPSLRPMGGAAPAGPPRPPPRRRHRPRRGPPRGPHGDPPAPCGQWEAQLRLTLVARLPVAGTVPDEVRDEVYHAIQTHPGVVLLPPTFVVVEVAGDAWAPLTGGDDPEEARERLARHFTGLLPRLREFQDDPATPAELAEWTALAEEIMAAAGHRIIARGREFRIVRVGRMLRLGRDGPEAPRPCDQDRYGLPDTAEA